MFLSFHGVFCSFWAFTKYFGHFGDSIGMLLFFRGLKGILVILEALGMYIGKLMNVENITFIFLVKNILCPS